MIKMYIGDEFETINGIAKITGWNGHAVYVTIQMVHFGEDEDGNIDFDDEKIVEEERTLTPEAIGRLMKEVDGHNHKVRICEKREA